MKKSFLLLLLCLPLLVQAQSVDTIGGRDGKYYKYYYSQWFDTSFYYHTPITPDNPYREPHDMSIYSFNLTGWHAGARILPMLAKREYVPRPSAMKGVAVLTTDKVNSGAFGEWYYVHPVSVDYTRDTLTADTCYVLQNRAGTDEWDILGSVRWDTATMKRLKIPLSSDSATAGFAYLMVYEAYFKTPISVDSVFYIAGSDNNCELENWYYKYPPRGYAFMCYGNPPDPEEPCGFDSSYLCVCFNLQNGKVILRENDLGYWMRFGCFLPILSYDSVYLNVRSDDSTMGSVSPRPGSVLQWIEHTITAVPKTGYRFTHWNDGNTENPRRVLMTRDASFTAYFEPKPLYNVTVEAIPPEWGHVEGGGSYYDGDTVTLEAIPDSNAYYFSHWQDYQQENPLSFIVTSDTLFTAHFTDENGISAPVTTPAPLFTLTPNPTTGEVTVTLGQPPLTPPEGGERITLTIHDAAGNEVLRKELVRPGISISLDLSDLPSGTYFVTLVTPTASGTQKLVVK